MKSAGEQDFDDTVAGIKRAIAWGARFGFLGGCCVCWAAALAMCGRWMMATPLAAFGLALYAFPWFSFTFGAAALKEQAKKEIGNRC